MAKTALKSPASRRSLLRVHLNLETDFLLARQRAKQIAAFLGFGLQDQTRVATAVSEIARNAWEYAGGGYAEFFLDPARKVAGLAGSPTLRIVIADKGPGIAQLDSIWAGTYRSPQGMGIGMLGARRLLDSLEVVSGPEGTTATLIRSLPRPIAQLPSVAEIEAHLARQSTLGGPIASTALHDQNQEPLTPLGELRTRETELRRLNVEQAELPGDSVGFTSAPGQGSTFVCTLPALAPRETEGGTPQPGLPAAHILIVDDDEVARYLLRRQLGLLTSAEIEEAIDGLSALDAMERNPPSIVFLDLLLPGMSGIEVARSIRDRPHWAQIPLVLHTGKALAESELQSLAALELTLVPKRAVSSDTRESLDLQCAEIERALLEVGLLNLHQKATR